MGRKIALSPNYSDSMSEKVPPVLVNQLADGGIMIIPVGEEKQNQMLMLVTKDKEGKVKTKPTLPVRFVPML